MAEQKVVASPAPPPPKQQIQRSVQEEPFSIEQGPGQGNSFIMWMATISDTFAAWGVDVKRRDEQLRDWWYTEPILAGAVYTVGASNAGFEWELIGPERTTAKVQQILQRADGGRGWQSFIKKLSTDLYTQDNGTFIEIVRTRNSPNAPIIGLEHLEAANCLRTGDVMTPVIYTDRRGKRHNMPWYSVVALSEMPSPIEKMNDVQYCAVTRILRAAQIMRDMEIFRGEKAGGRFTEAIHLIGGASKKNIEDVRARMQEQADNQGTARYLAPIIVEALDPQATPQVATLNLKSLPESFNVEEEFRQYVAMIALGFGRDYQEFAPLPGRGIGSGSQSEVLHLKARGKGPADFMALLTNALNSYVMPRTVTFQFSEQDVELEKQEAENAKIRAEERKIRIDSGEIPAIIARQIAQDDGDLDPIYLELMGEGDLTPDIVLEQEEKPAPKREAVGQVVQETPEEVEEKMLADIDMADIDDYMGRFKGFFKRSLAKVKRDTEESEAVKGLKLAAAALAETAGQPDVVVITDPNAKEQKVTVEMPPIEVPEEFTEAVKELKEAAEKIADTPPRVVIMPSEPTEIKVEPQVTVEMPEVEEEIITVLGRDKDKNILKTKKVKKYKKAKK